MKPAPQRPVRFLAEDSAHGGPFVGERLDLALVRRIGGISRARLQEWIREGRVSVAGEVVEKPSRILEEGESVELAPPAAVPEVAVEDAPLPRILYEDEDLVAFDKPAGLVVHRNERYGGGTLADLAQSRYGPLPEVQGEHRPGIVHRLDRETSGVIVLGRTVAALEDLKRQFKERGAQKSYLAFVHESPRFDSEWIEEPIGPDERHPERKTVVPRGEGREASTYYEVLERFRGFSLVECRPRTGRTHQIRVHLSWAGHSIVGDRLYARRGPWSITLPSEAPVPERQLLHALELRLSHPRTQEPLVLRAEPPEDFRLLHEWLKANAAL